MTGSSRAIKFVITDANGTDVRTIQNKEDRPKTGTSGNILKRLTYVKQGIAIPPTLRWDGMSDGGTVVPEGTYTYHIEAWDDNGNLGKSPNGTVVVKTTPPKITVSTPYLIFSPNGDGNKETLPLQQAGLDRKTRGRARSRT